MFRSTPSRRGPLRSDDPLRFIVGVLLLAVMTAVVYAPAMRGGYLWDDTEYVRDNVTLRSTRGLLQIWFDPQSSPQYYPLTFTTFWLEYRLWGSAPVGYHITNVVLHVVNAVLVWTVLRRLRVVGSLAAAAVFALHPVQVDSVAWIAERKDVLSGTFALLAVLAWLRFLETRRWWSYASVLVLFIGALLSKTAVCTLPLVLLLVTWWQKPSQWRHDLWRSVALLAIGVPLGLMTAWRERLYGNPAPMTSDVDRVLVAGRALWFYAWKLIYPANLMAIYPRWEVDSGSPWQYVFPVTVATVFGALWLFRRRFGKAPLVAGLSFALTLLPALGFVDFNLMVFSYVADHFQYLAAISLIALFCAVAARASRRLGTAQRWVGPAVAGSVLLALGAATWHRSHIYQEAETLWRDNLAKDPHVWGAHNYLGKALLDKGRLDAAIEQFAAALEMKPSYTDARNYWAAALERQGKLDEAAQQYRLALSARQPRRQAYAHNALGRVLTLQGRFAEALPHFAAAVQIKPDYAEAYSNWGQALIGLGRVDEARAQYAAALRLDPTDANAHNNLATVLAREGKFDEAVEHFRAALRLRPEDADVHFNLALLLARAGRLDEALRHCAAAVRLNPNHADAHNTMGKILMMQGRFEEAVPHFTEAIRLAPGSADARNNLQRALAQRQVSP